MTRRLIDLPEMIVRDVAELPDRTSPPEAPEMMLVTAPELDRIVSARVAELTDERDATVAACAACVPTSWLDPLLSGPKKIADFADGPAVERLLLAIRERIAAVNIHKRGEK